MAKQFKMAAAVLGLAASLAGGSAFAQAAGGNVGMQGGQGQGMGGQAMGGQAMGGQAGGGSLGIQGAGIGGVGGGQGFVAPVPQYWLADASIFIRNAANTARTMSKEQSLNVQAPQIIGSQAQFLVNSAGRALADLNGLLQNANATNPQAVPRIRRAMAELVAAQAQAHQVFVTASQGALGPTYSVTVTAALGHLQAAEREIAAITRAYGAGFGTGLGIGGGAQGGGAQGGGAQQGGGAGGK